MGAELKLAFRWIDIEKIEQKSSLLTYTVKVETRQGKYSFHFVTEEPYKTIQQLADLAARNVMDGDQARVLKSLFRNEISVILLWHPNSSSTIKYGKCFGNKKETK